MDTELNTRFMKGKHNRICSPQSGNLFLQLLDGNDKGNDYGNGCSLTG